MTTSSARKLRRIAIRDGFRCKKCRIIPIYPTIDHIQPKSLGRNSKDGNLELLCHLCHRKKDEVGSDCRIVQESMVCGMLDFSPRFLRRFKINPKDKVYLLNS
ncbi:MAG: HNH endonuclease signature motif containing protein [Candidatus Nitrosopolaris sp.]